MATTAPEGLGLPVPNISMVFEAEEDIEQELEDFVRLKRMGDYGRAQEVFRQSLAKNAHLFPVTAEYADLLLEQHEYRTLSGYLDIQMDCMEGLFEEDEMELLAIMKSLVGIHTQGTLRSAITRARQSWEFLWNRRTRVPQGELPSDVEIHIFEVYISIIAFAVANSNWVGLDDMKCPWTEAALWPRSGFVQWYQVLSQHDHLWEASRVLQILLSILPVLPPEDACALFDKYCFQHSAPLTSPPETGESHQVITFIDSLNRAQALLRLALILHVHQSDVFGSKTLFETARLYHFFADVKLTVFQIDAQHGLHHFELNSQKVEFQRAEQVLGLSKASRASPDLTFENPNKSFIMQDCNFFMFSSVHSFMQYLQGHSETFDLGDCLLSLYNFQTQRLGDLAGFIRAWDLFCTILERRGISKANYNETAWSPEFDACVLFRDLPKKFPATGFSQPVLSALWDISQRIEIYDDPTIEFEADITLDDRQYLPQSFDVPLLLWAIHNQKASIASHLKFASPSRSKDCIEMVQGCLPVPIIPERARQIASHVQETLAVRDIKVPETQHSLSKNAKAEVTEGSPHDVKSEPDDIENLKKSYEGSSAGQQSNYMERLFQPADSPAFCETEILESVCAGGGNATGNIVKPKIKARIDKGFFLVNERWTCYRRNYFTVSCSFTLQPWISGPLFLKSNEKSVGENIRAFSMSISAIVNSNCAEIRELFQHTSKRDKQSERKPGRIVLQPCQSPLSTAGATRRASTTSMDHPYPSESVLHHNDSLSASSLHFMPLSSLQSTTAERSLLSNSPHIASSASHKNSE